MYSLPPNSLTIKTVLLGALAGYFVTCKLPKIIGPVRIFSSEPGACSVIRETLLATQKVANWQQRNDPATPLELPKIPFNLIEDCGRESFNMPFPYTFKWSEESISEEDLVRKFLAKNKTVAYRPAADLRANPNTPFTMMIAKLEKMHQGSFEEAWPCISKGKCTLYFDNTWVKEDYESIMPDNVVKTLIEGSSFGSMFMSSYKNDHITAAAHSAPQKSLATQITKSKKWIFIDPMIAKEYHAVDENEFVSVLHSMSQDHDKVLKSTPRYEVITGPGDGVYFPEFWFHIVFTEGGLNTMTNWRMSAQLLEGFRRSPHTFRKKLWFMCPLFLKEYVFPDWIAKLVLAQGHDFFQENVHKMFRFRKSLLDANNGSRFKQ